MLQNQECFGGCFSTNTAYDGKLANVRIWDRVLDRTQIQLNMFTNNPPNTQHLVMSYHFDEKGVRGFTDRQMVAVDRMGTCSAADGWGVTLPCGWDMLCGSGALTVQVNVSWKGSISSFWG